MIPPCNRGAGTPLFGKPKRGTVAELKCHATFFYQYRNYTFDNSGRCSNVPYLAPPSEDINLK
jgi:hypothetical protein